MEQIKSFNWENSKFEVKSFKIKSFKKKTLQLSYRELNHMQLKYWTFTRKPQSAKYARSNNIRRKFKSRKAFGQTGTGSLYLAKFLSPGQNENCVMATTCRAVGTETSLVV